MKRSLALMVSEVKYTFRDKMVLFWLIAWPVFWVLMSAFIFVPPGAGQPITLDVGVLNLDDSNITLNGLLLVRILSMVEYNGTKIFNIHNYTSRQALIDDLRKGRIDAGIIIPRGFGRNATMSVAKLEVLIGARSLYSASITSGVLKGFIGEFSRRIGVRRALTLYNYTVYYISRFSGNYTNTTNSNMTGFLRFYKEYMIGIAVPINASFKDVRPPGLETRETILGWITIGAIGMVALYTGLAYGASILASEKEAGVLKRLIATPLREEEYLAAHSLAMMVELGVASIVIIITGVYGTGARIIFDPLNPLHWLAAGLLLVAALQTFSIGAIMAPLAKTSKSATGMGTSIGLILAFLAGIWFPESMLPPSLRPLAEYFPVTWTIKAIRQILVYDAGWNDISWLVIGSTVSLIALYVAAWFILLKLLKKYLEG